MPAADRLYVLVGGWPGSGKSTIATTLAAELGIPVLAKDELKHGLTDVLGSPGTFADSHRLGRAAVHALLRLAPGCHSAVLDSTWFPYSAALTARLPGTLVELRCIVPRGLAQNRLRARGDRGVAEVEERIAAEPDLWREPPLHWGSVPWSRSTRVARTTSGSSPRPCCGPPGGSDPRRPRSIACAAVRWPDE